MILPFFQNPNGHIISHSDMMRKYSPISFSLQISHTHTSVNFETDKTQFSTIHILIATFFLVLVIGNWVIGFFNPITSIDNANYLV
jgi:hypothetical protein